MALVKNADKWLLYEDESVELVNEGVVQSVFGSSQVRVSLFNLICKGEAGLRTGPITRAHPKHVWLWLGTCVEGFASRVPQDDGCAVLYVESTAGQMVVRCCGPAACRWQAIAFVSWLPLPSLYRS